jgi:L-iditol 2-dehydrogenase
MHMVMRGARISHVGFANEPVPVDVAKLVRNHISVFGIRGAGRSATHRAAALVEQRRFEPRLIHTHTFRMDEVPTAFHYSRDRIDGAIKVVVKMRDGENRI